MKVIKGGIATPIGFKANGISAGMKRSGKPDLGLIVSDVPAKAAAVFTKNSVVAAPLVISQKHIANGCIQAIISNSANANCFTGQTGLKNAQLMTSLTAKECGIKNKDVFVLSTGIIGKQLSIGKIKTNIKPLVQGLSRSGSHKFARAILTTDTKTKEIAVQIKLSGKTITVAGCAKGSGMIAPNMATMLGYITTDANINAALLKAALKEATNHSFNAINVDGCMSTNDTVVALANGKANNKLINSKNADYKNFLEAMQLVSIELAKMIVLDGEGATKFISINVTGAKSNLMAHNIAIAISNSMLVKTAAYGNSPNWGRVAAAVGSLGIKQITERNLRINFSSYTKKEMSINVQLNLGKAAATVFTCDLSHKYININTAYC